MSERRRLVKLVRDGVSRFIVGEAAYTYEPVEGDLVPLLKAKLLEECGEYLLDPSVGELADILEVVYALAAHEQGVSWQTVIDTMRAKRIERGGFDNGVAMYVLTNAPATHEGEHAQAA